jgi:hypothetical protein
VSALNRLLNVDRMKRIAEQVAFHGDDAYSLEDLFSDVRVGIWSEAMENDRTDVYRRNLQRAHVERLAALMEDEDALASDVAAYARNELRFLRGMLATAEQRANHAPTQLHFADLVARIDTIMEG